MNKLHLILFLVLFPIGEFLCSGQPDTIIKPQYINVVTLKVDFDTYTFEGGNITYFNKCERCDGDSLPFNIVYNGPHDFGDIAFKLLSTEDTIFAGGIVWMGIGHIYNPKEFSVDYPFTTSTNKVPMGDVKYYNMEGKDFETIENWLLEKADSAWEPISSLEITNLFAEKDYKAGIFLYAPEVGTFNPHVAKWIVFLYYNDLSYTETDMETIQKTKFLYPNPVNDVIYVDNESEISRFEIICIDGIVIRIFKNINDKINISDLKPGVYMLKYYNGKDNNTRLFIKN